MPGGLHRLCCCSGSPGDCLTPITETGIEINFFNCHTPCDCQSHTETQCRTFYRFAQVSNIQLNGTYVLDFRASSPVEFASLEEPRATMEWFTNDPVDGPATCTDNTKKDTLSIRVYLKDLGGGNCGVLGISADATDCKAAFAYYDTTPAAYTDGTQLNNRACGWHEQDLGGTAAREIADLVMIDGGYATLNFALNI